ncbi:MAG: WecB/TagA/CpsF family glycosyltransferase [Eubacterium sp.]|nr:WecB/TagA/CpsF family glycosyltransferase [Eubacterium sp.]
MGTKVQIMDLELDLLTQETFEKNVTEYLSNDVLNVVHMISLDYVDTYDENELVRDILAEADLVLPGEKAILSAHHVEVLETGGMVVNYRSLMSESLEEILKDKTFYLIDRSEKEAKQLFRYLARHFSSEQVLGVYAADGEESEEVLINDINTKLPDVIILSMGSTRQEEWIHNHKNKLNAKICLVAGSIVPHILRDNVHVPQWVERMHLAELYRFVAKIPNAKFFRKRIFKRKMNHYTTKKRLWGSIHDEKNMDEH